MPRLRKRALALMGGAVVLFILGTNVQAGWLFVLSAFLLGTVVAGAGLAGRMTGGLHVERRVSAEVHQGDEALVELAITNTTGGLRAGVVIDDPMVAPASFDVGSLRPGERVELLTVRVAERRGPQADAKVTLRSAAPFGVAERRRPTAAPATCLVLPRVHPLGKLSFVDATATSERALHSFPRRGAGPEYLGVREYRPGDSMRHVHWPSTARTGTVMVRELEEERTRRLAIVVDAVADVGETWTPLDAVCSAAASIALAAAADGQGARLLAGGSDGVEEAPHGDGRALLRHLGRLGPSGVPLSDAGRDLTAALRGAETAVVIFPTWRVNAPSALVPALAAIGTAGVRVVAVPVVLDAGTVGRFAMDPPDVARAIDDLRRNGFETLPWTPGEDLGDALSSRRSAEALAP